MALGEGDLPMAYFDAMAPMETTIEADEWNENAARHIAQHFKGKQ